MEKEMKSEESEWPVVLVIPDVHGRDFWQDPVLDTLSHTDVPIIFLGDYLDPYQHEWPKDVDPRRISIEMFKWIIDLKKQNPDRITLLIGNHDCGYAINEDISCCRIDNRNKNEIRELFEQNWDLFQLAASRDIAGKHFLFSHAGILKGWAMMLWEKWTVNDPKFNIVDALNNAWTVKDERIMNALGYYDYHRGWGGCPYGSPVWSDIRSWFSVTPEETFGYNIVGHTQCQSRPIILDTIADLDCQKPFYINNKGEIKEFCNPLTTESEIH